MCWGPNITTGKQSKETTIATRSSTIRFSTVLETVITTMKWVNLNCLSRQTKPRKETLTLNQPDKFWKTCEESILRGKEEEISFGETSQCSNLIYLFANRFST